MRTALPLKVLTPDLAQSLRTFNDAARLLQRMGVRLHRLEPTEGRVTIAADDARQLLEKGYLMGLPAAPVTSPASRASPWPGANRSATATSPAANP